MATWRRQSRSVRIWARAITSGKVTAGWLGGPVRPVLPAAAEPGSAGWFLRPVRRDPPRRADAGGGPVPVAAAGQELLVAAVRCKDLRGGGDVGLQGFGGAAEPAQVTAAKQR